MGSSCKRPLGVVVAIVPWNFPTTLLGNKLGPALVCGNIVVAKPAETTPLTTLRIAAIMREARRCRRTSSRSSPARAPCSARRSSPTRASRRSRSRARPPLASSVAELAARGVKRVTLELGGSDPMIVLDDADVDGAVSAASVGRFFNCGQACLAVKRAVRPRARSPTSSSRSSRQGRQAHGRRGTAEGTTIGPLHSEEQRGRSRSRSSRRLAQGGELLPGGERPDGDGYASGWFYEPTLILEPPHDSRVATEEVFGPALPIWRVRASRRRSSARTQRLRARLVDLDARPDRRDDRCGEARSRLHVDQLGPDRLRRAPFGGFGESGIGKEHGIEALDYYQESKAVVVKQSPR